MSESNKCCSKCFDEGVSQLSYGGCSNPNCPCHSATLDTEMEIDEDMDVWPEFDEYADLLGLLDTP